MKKRVKIIAACLAVTTVLGCGVAYAKNQQQSIDAYYQNIKLVVDGVTIEPKDANGNLVEPFIFEGTTYLPVRAVGEAFGKDVTWDGTTATVDLHTPREKEKMEISLYDRPYTDCEDPNNFRTYAKEGHSYIYCAPKSNYVEESESVLCYSNSVTYPLNGKADTFKGEFFVGSGASDSVEGVLKVYDSRNKVIYTSPIMRNSTAHTNFEIPVAGEQEIRIEFHAKAEYSSSYRDMYIKNPIIVTSDY